ncbi:MULTISPECIES: HlyD family efflux transporter periplasmic adaptor subunit [unclassified Acidovorax]|uniref:HlyD family secretion protein n=1 Tax=unclassified Acidovorax TaxID=2684926 RepID=UPI0023DE4A25|nr:MULTISPECIES: HlyD family efflux transporter periplasmic adaptor subunit [unclassified Acidovorax]GKS92098.1 HlyD family efflux transporter periplasmic adaptor subunit [Acidovorax sp. SUPP2539]GKS95011.1 HlyD family efflux transporter periplasmic adaptor subunit [Acidovorax sp. SUPP2825]GKS98542.1 HlyD family efflux transporter periplasmic adaptor subunit [Acidovorax sp. SUPP3434]
MTRLPLTPPSLLGLIPALLATAVLLVACNEKPLPSAVAAEPPPPAQVAVARGKIEVPGGLLELSPAQEGLVQAVAVQEGQTVQRGQLLLRLAGDAAGSEAAVAQSELHLAQARHQARAQRLPALRRTAARLSEAVTAGAAEPQRADEALQAVRDAEADLAVSQAEAEVARSRLAQVQAQRARLELHAPEDGTVVRVGTQAGQRAPASGSAAAITLLPRRPLVVRAELNESYAAQVHVGQRATVTTDGDTAAAAMPPAHVVRISPVLGTGRLQDDVQRGPVRIVECVLEFDQAPTARVGQNVRVSFHE